MASTQAPSLHVYECMLLARNLRQQKRTFQFSVKMIQGTENTLLPCL